MKKHIIDQKFDEERSLYHLQDAEMIGCIFAGEKDGESVLKESRNIKVQKCKFSLRYPLWHAENFEMVSSVMDDKSRAPIWYARNGSIENSNIEGVKCLRECENIDLSQCKILSPEFGWKCIDIKMTGCTLESEYVFFDSRNIEVSNIQMKGKYSFQYIENLHIRDSYLDTKDAFWHSKNVLIENSVIKGEYLGWFSEGLTLKQCKIIGTQPLCYCKNLKLIDCTMDDTDLAFEYSEVDANIQGYVQSIKNPKSGKIVADKVGKVIWEDSIMDVHGIVETRS